MQRIPLDERLALLDRLGDHLLGEDDFLRAIMNRSYHHNHWFTIANQERAVRSIAEEMLDRHKLDGWISAYDVEDPTDPKTVGLVLAGNIPLVGFHDWLCTFAAGHRAQIKLSEKDQFLMPYLIKLLTKYDERVADYVSFTEKLKDFDAVIATGSNNSSRYFQAYFGKYPHIIRKNRNAIGVLDGTETAKELEALGEDVFRYFGLGCRNVAKIYVPEGYDFDPLLESLHEFRDVILHTKYKNNFDYNYSIFVLNKVPYLANGCILLTENTAIASHIAGLYYETYTDRESLNRELAGRKEEIQCAVSHHPVPEVPTFGFGQAQQPALSDYADGVDTIAFLQNLD
jgi:hypothetical protein